MRASLIARLICLPLSTSLIARLIIRYVPMYPSPAKLKQPLHASAHHGAPSASPQVRAHVPEPSEALIASDDL